jgi:peptidoglycan/xylan/chitin deacetylase (PgdA/CDA1 family)
MAAVVRRLRDVTRDALARLLYALDVTRPGRALAGRLTIVTFHRVLPPELRARYPLPHLAVPPDLFGQLLAAFRAAFRCLPLAEAVEAARSGPGERPLLAVTFDDGLRDNFEWARPLLRRHDVRATFFVVAENARTGEMLWHDRLAYAAARAAQEPHDALRARLEGAVPDATRDALVAQRRSPAFAHGVVRAAKALAAPARARLEASLGAASLGASLPEFEGMMDFAQLRALAGDGHEIGSHSMTHALLRSELAPDFDRETAGSRRALETELGAPVRSFCYPDGAHDERAVAAVRAAGYATAVTTRPGVNRLDADPLRLRRHNLEAEANQSRDGSLSVPRLALRLSAVFARES